MHSLDTESVELASYRLRDAAVYWYIAWMSSRGANAPPPMWKQFVDAFLRQYFPPEVHRARVDRFLTLRQGNRSVREYSLQCNSLARYAPTIVVEMEDRVHRFVAGLEPLLINECSTTALLDGMDIAHIQAYTQNLEDQKGQQSEDLNEGQSKRARSSSQLEDVRGSFRPPHSVTGIPSPSQRLSYSDSSRDSRTSSFQYQRDSARMRMPLPRCSQCGRAHSGRCRQGSDVCYTCGVLDHEGLPEE
ncbi:uncharacterized protein LOC132644102 [Lycium barbarum]|uniref:uncharacterized protein LOC132644102 n=1 Tax=Lycium barbarum TaxID=112863 RepID=UPI00293F0D23|nr:uncharacterized protein LOC132644102 [Lycium barbarum]